MYLYNCEHEYKSQQTPGFANPPSLEKRAKMDALNPSPLSTPFMAIKRVPTAVGGCFTFAITERKSEIVY